MQYNWQWGIETTEPLIPVSVDEFHQDLLRSRDDWHHALVILPTTPKEQNWLKVGALAGVDIYLSLGDTFISNTDAPQPVAYVRYLLSIDGRSFHQIYIFVHRVDLSPFVFLS